MHEENFLMKMGLLFKYLGQKPDSGLIKIYWEELKTMTDQDFDCAVNNIIRNFIPTTANPFPLISHIIKFSSNDTHGQAIKAISAIKLCIRRVGKYESVNWGDNALTLLIELQGGWSAICDWTDKTWDINENRLIEAYKVHLNTYYSNYSNNINSFSHNAGICEQSGGVYRIYHTDILKQQLIGYEKYIQNKLIETHGKTHKSLNTIEINKKNSIAIELKEKNF